MILNLSKIKTQSLLLFCRDLILTYKENINTNDSLSKEFDEICETILKEIDKVSFPNEYYIKNNKNFQIKAVLKAYDFINNMLAKNLKQNQLFNPSMLCFSLLALWFKELDKERKSKEYIYFTLYPYGHIYDKLLVNMKDIELKKLNILMIELAEKVIFAFDKYSLK